MLGDHPERQAGCARARFADPPGPPQVARFCDVHAGLGLKYAGMPAWLSILTTVGLLRQPRARPWGGSDVAAVSPGGGLRDAGGGVDGDATADLLTVLYCRQFAHETAQERTRQDDWHLRDVPHGLTHLPIHADAGHPHHLAVRLAQFDGSLLGTGNALSTGIRGCCGHVSLDAEAPVVLPFRDDLPGIRLDDAEAAPVGQRAD